MKDHSSLEYLKARVSLFAKRDSPGAMHVHGDWGVGKTYAVLEALRAKEDDDQIPFSYVSLYGISNLNDIYMRLTLGWANKISQKLPDWLMPISRMLKGSKAGERTRDAAGNIISAFIGKERMDAASASVAGLLASKMLIVFDDLERKDPDLGMHVLLGVISYLVESRECKVIFISNDGQIPEDEKKIFDLHKEKIFDFEIPYFPTIEENSSIFAKDFTDILNPVLKALNVRNLRVINRTVGILERLTNEMPADFEFSKSLVLDSAAKISVLHYGFRSKIDISDLSPSRPLGFSEMVFGDDENLNEGDKLIVQSQIRSGPCDDHIIEVVTTGETDWESFRSKTLLLNKETAQRTKNRKLQEFIRSLLTSYSVNDPDIASKLRQECEENILLLDTTTIAWAGNVLVELGESDPRDKWFRQWKERNLEKLSDEDIRHALSGFDGLPQELRAAYRDEAERRRPPLNIENILLRRFTNEVYHPADIERISKLSDGEYVKWLRTSDNADVRMLIREVFENFYGKEGSEGLIAKKILKAVDLLAKESKLNEFRAKHFKSALPKHIGN